MFVAATATQLLASPLGYRAPLHITPDNYLDDRVDLSAFDWYHGRLGKVEAESLLDGAPHGTFLVRNRTGRRGEFVLTWKTAERLAHILVKPVANSADPARVSGTQAGSGLLSLCWCTDSCCLFLFVFAAICGAIGRQ